MKTIRLMGFIVLSLLVYSNGINAQRLKARLNQVELMKQWIGSWRTEGTNTSSEIRSFGTDGLEGFQKTEIKDSIASEFRFLWGYNKKDDKYIAAYISKNSSGVTLMSLWFTSKKSCTRIPFEFISNPDMAASKAVFEFKSKDLIIGTYTEKNSPDRKYTIIREKK